MLNAAVQELAAFAALAVSVGYIVYRYIGARRSGCDGCPAGLTEARTVAVRHRLPVVSVVSLPRS